MAKHARVSTKAKQRRLWPLALSIVVLLIAGVVAVVLIRPPFALGALDLLGVPAFEIPGMKSTTQADASAQSYDSERQPSRSGDFYQIGDTQPNAAQLAAEQELYKQSQPTPRIAQGAGIDLYCPIVPQSLTGVLFHQASSAYALQLTTALPECAYDKAADRAMRINHDQVSGEWLEAEAVHVWRTSDSTDMDTSIDIGALPGTQVRSPISGTVVLVRDYSLYGELDDIEIHIQPDGRPDLDCVLIHTTDPAVKAGDRVVAGVTPLSKVRDIESALSDVQLGFFTPEGVGGNHTHVQLNNADYPEYREKRLPGALTP